MRRDDEHSVCAKLGGLLYLFDSAKRAVLTCPGDERQFARNLVASGFQDAQVLALVKMHAFSG
jgi:hypothetical protein